MAHYDEAAELYGQLRIRQGEIKYVQRDEFVEGAVESFFDISTLWSLERFVRRVVAGQVHLFRGFLGKRRNGCVPEQLKIDFKRLKCIGGLYCDRYTYSVYVTSLFDVCGSLGLMDEAFTEYWHPWVPPALMWEGGAEQKCQWQIFDDLVLLLRERACAAEARSQIRQRRAIARRDFERAVEYVNACFEASPTLFILRLDLGYRHSWLDMHQNMRVGQDLVRLKKDFAGFTKRISGKSFQGIVGHLAKVEYGREKGYLIHIAVLLEGRECECVEEWEMRLGYLWMEQITRGEGAYYNCYKDYANDKRFPDKAIGLVERSSIAKRLALERWVIGYITLSSQYLRVKVEPRERVFFKGNKPKAEITNRGSKTWNALIN